MPVEQKGKRSLTTCSSDNIRWYTGEEMFDSTSYMKSMAKDICKQSRRPDLGTEVEKFMLEKKF